MCVCLCGPGFTARIPAPFSFPTAAPQSNFSLICRSADVVRKRLSQIEDHA